MCLGDLNSLKKIYDISCADNISFLRFFPEYQDFGLYGNLPNCLQKDQLFALNSTFNWDDPVSYGIRNNKELYVATLCNAFIAPSCLGTVFDTKQQLLFDIFVSPGYPIFWPLTNDVNSMSIVKYKKLATVQGPTYFYHWVMDRLPSVFLLSEYMAQDSDIVFLINNQEGRVAGYVGEYLDLLGIPEDRRIVAQKNVLYSADTVYFATPFLMEPIPKNLLLALRNKLLIAAELKECSREYSDNLIVVLQRRESNRKIVNINELLTAIGEEFSPEKFEIVLFDGGMSVSEQILLFNRAQVVIGAMASGLTNVMYCKPGTSVIEIHPELSYLVDCNGVNNWGGEWCWWLSSVADLDYWFVLSPFQLTDPSLMCPMNEIKQTLKKVALKHVLRNT